jgi:hypothetical protein
MIMPLNKIVGFQVRHRADERPVVDETAASGDELYLQVSLPAGTLSQRGQG